MKLSASIEKHEIVTRLNAMKNDGILKVHSCSNHIDKLDQYKNDFENSVYKNKEKSVVKIIQID